jgi:hypothetical protein
MDAALGHITARVGDVACKDSAGAIFAYMTPCLTPALPLQAEPLVILATTAFAEASDTEVQAALDQVGGWLVIWMCGHSCSPLGLHPRIMKDKPLRLHP